MVLTTYAIEKMGYRLMTGGESISAHFFSLCTFEVNGLDLGANEIIESAGSIGEVEYRVALGSSVNSIAQSLIGEELTDNEVDWEKENKCSPPYLMVHVGPTCLHTVTEGYFKAEENHFHTYDCFSLAKDELKKLELKVLPNLITALSCAFSESHDQVRFKRVSVDRYGKVLSGETLFDRIVSISAAGTSIKQIDLLTAKTRLNQATSRAPKITPKVSNFFLLALDENDHLKRFLYFFLTIECQTHTAFKKLDSAAHASSLTQGGGRAHMILESFLISQSKNLRSLHDRFAWCAINLWTNLNNEDVEEFKRMKKVRDSLAHGDISNPPPEAVLAVERLARKLQLAPNVN